MINNNTTVLESHTLRYWQVSRAWNGQSLEEIPTCDAIESTNDIIYGLMPTRSLVRQTNMLQREIIRGGGRIPYIEAPPISLMKKK